VRTLRAAALLTRKDLVSLRRAPLVVILLACYPLLIAGLVGLVAGYANARPRVAVVDLDHIPAKTTVAGHTYQIKNLIDEVAKNVRISWMSRAQAAQALRTGEVVGVITIPPGFITDLKSVVRSPQVEFETSQGGISSRVTQQMQASGGLSGRRDRLHLDHPQRRHGQLPRLELRGARNQEGALALSGREEKPPGGQGRALPR